MTTATDTKIDLHTARKAIESVIADAALTQWEEIAQSVEEHGPEMTIDFLKGYVAPHFRHHRITSRSTSMVSNLLDDMKFGIYTGAIFVIEEEMRLLAKFEEENIVVGVAKAVRSAGRRAAANI